MYNTDEESVKGFVYDSAAITAAMNAAAELEEDGELLGTAFNPLHDLE